MRKRSALILLAVLTGSVPARAGEIWDELMGYYSQRAEGVTLRAGDAKEANSAIHAADPWPPYAGNRKIPASGERMSRAIRRYQDVTKLQEAAHVPVSEVSGTTAIGAGNGMSSSGR
ncbi:MAG: hypothetical protein ACLPJW_08235 [Rhodomicrobium sp.]